MPPTPAAEKRSLSAPARGLLALALSCGALACGQESTPADPPPPAPPPEPAAAAARPVSSAPADLPKAIVLSLAHFVTEGGKLVPGPARLEFLVRQGGEWRVPALEDPESNVFHKAMLYPATERPALITLGGMAAAVKLWTRGDAGEILWQKDFGGKFNRMRDAEIADLDGDGDLDLAVATHDQGVVAVLYAEGESFRVEEVDAEPDTFVHEIEIGDLDGDGVAEVYATPSAPNKLDGTPQPGKVVRYVPAKGEGRSVVADLGNRHAKEILVADVDGDGRDELYVSVEAHVEKLPGGGERLVEPVELLRYDADTPADAGRVIGTLDDRQNRFLTAGDVDGDGRQELVAAAWKRGIWIFRPGDDPLQPWESELVDADSGGFEHAAILVDLDEDGRDELYVASDDHKEVRRYVWDGRSSSREVIYRRPDDRPIFTWNLMPVPAELVWELMPAEAEPAP